MGLVGAEDYCFLVLVYYVHEKLDPIAFSFFNFNDAVEVFFGVVFLLVYRSF